MKWLYRVIHQACSLPFPPWIMNFIYSNYGFWNFLNILEDHIFKILTFFFSTTKGVSCGDTNFCFLNKYLFFALNYLVDVLFWTHFDVPNSKFDWVISLLLNVCFKDNSPYKMVLYKYKIDVKLDLVFIILGQFLHIINIDRLTLIATIFKSP